MKTWKRIDEYRLPETEELKGEGFVLLYTPNGVREDGTPTEITTLVIGDFDEQYAVYGDHREELTGVVADGLDAVKAVFREFESTFDFDKLV